MRLSINFTIEISSGNKLDRPQSWGVIRRQVKQRDNSTCRYCGRFILDGHVDHVVPVSRGGKDELDNLVWSCPECNISKGNKTLGEWGATLLNPVSCIKIEMSESEGPSHQFDLPVREDVLIRMAMAVLEEDRNFSRRSLSPDVISESQFNRLLKVMLEEGLVEYKNGQPQAGTILTFKGLSLLREFLPDNRASNVDARITLDGASGGREANE